MPRKFAYKKFNEAYDEIIRHGNLNEVPEYYSIYKKRYVTLIEKFCSFVSNTSADVLDIGGGQYALLCKNIWGDNAYLADIVESNFTFLEKKGVKAIKWDLSTTDFPIDQKFDFIFFSEVIEHLPIPGHIALERLKKVLKPGGVLICTTPNLYRIRNVIFLALGKSIFDYFRFSDGSMGHMLEYSKDHIEWQLNKAGFKEFNVEIKQLHNSRTSLFHRIIAWIGSPIYLIPRFRDNLLILAKNVD